MNLKEIQDFIKAVIRSGASEVEVELPDVKIKVKTDNKTMIAESSFVQQVSSGTPVSVPLQQPFQPFEKQQITEASDVTNEKLFTVRSPIVGTFYKRPSPDKPNFVEVGSTIRSGQVLCIIEAMKLFNEIESEVNGKIVKILVEDSQPVEFDQPMFVVELA